MKAQSNTSNVYSKAKRYPMPIDRCQHYGTWFAANGYSEEQVGNWLIDNGYKLDGLTARRMMRYYAEQLVRG